MKRKQENKSEDQELVTKGFLKEHLTKELNKQFSYRFGRFRKSFGEEIRREIKEESHQLEFRLVERMDGGFSAIREEMKKQTDIFQRLADMVIGAHRNFETESASIKDNYHKLEERVQKVEVVVFPSQD